MDEWLARFLMVIESVGLISVTALTAYWMKLRHERRTLGEKSSVAELERLLEEHRATTQLELNALHERLDFAERLLANRNLTPLPPEVTTPV